MGWTNWAGNQTAEPTAVVHPSGTDEIAQAVKAAAASGRRVKAVGSGHSFTAVAVTDGVQVQLDRHTALVDVDPKRGHITVQAGLPLHVLNPLLQSHGLSLTNMGDVDAQTVSGAISTGTHGTGRASASIAAQVVGLELVLADGSVLTCSPTENADVFEHARLGLGALGVLSTVTFQVEPLFHLHADERPMPLADVLAGYDGLVGENDHFEFFWFPHTDLALTKRNNRTSDPVEPLSPTKAYVDDVLLSNHLFQALCSLGSAAPRLIPPVNRLSSKALSARTYTDVSHKVFISRRSVRFHEMEYAVPRADLPEVFREVQRTIDKLGENISFPVEVRAAPADDIPLSTASGRDSSYIALHQYRRTSYERYFNAVEPVFKEVAGRPHWGKLHNLTAEDLSSRYPRFEDFLAVRRRLDPEGLFANAYLDTVLGRP